MIVFNRKNNNINNNNSLSHARALIGAQLINAPPSKCQKTHQTTNDPPDLSRLCVVSCAHTREAGGDCVIRVVMRLTSDAWRHLAAHVIAPRVRAWNFFARIECLLFHFCNLTLLLLLVTS